MSFIKSVIQDAAKIGEVAAPIITTAIGAGPAPGMALSKGISKIAQSKKLGGKGFTPSSASSVTQARSQDRARMSQQYPNLNMPDIGDE